MIPHPDKENYHIQVTNTVWLLSDNIFAEFEGRLESASIPTSRIDDFE